MSPGTGQPEVAEVSHPSTVSRARTTRPTMSDITAVVPARNAAPLLPECLTALRESGVAEIVVVDGCSTDATVRIAEEFGATVLSDDGRGLPVARALGAEHAGTRLVVLVDADVVFEHAGLQSLLDEFLDGGYVALQAGLLSVAGPGYWGQALVKHHRGGRSRRWFGLVATLFQRDDLVRIGFDDRFVSGEDIELRWRMRDEGLRIGVSDTVMVRHRFAGDDFPFARDQFLMDGAGLGRMVRARRWRGAALLALPAAAAARGVALSIKQGEPRWVPYYAAFGGWNYVGMARGLRR